jgi:signal transduction histidine kinase
MLRRASSLARLAAVIFMSVYAAMLIAVLALSAAVSWADRGQGNLRGPVLAVEYASAELRRNGGRLQLPRDGRFAKLAARNPSMWLIILKDGRSYTLGAVPEAAARTVAQLQTVVDAVTLRLPGRAPPLDAVSVQRRETASGPILAAAGGVDPVTLSTMESIDILVNPAVVVALAMIAAISLLGMLLAIPSFSRALRPITTEAEAIGPETSGRRLDERIAPQELLPLVRGFNAALDRLDIELGRRKRFIADVAHELRTPLAVVSLRVDALDPVDGKEDLRRGLGRLTHLVSQMLDLERLSLSSRQRSSMDLVAIARDVVADLAPMAIKGGYDLALTAPDIPVIVAGDAHAVARAITNLVGNAIAYGGGAGQLTVVVREDCTIDVMDEGPGVPPALQPLLFEPFARGDLSTEGCGLGLHLVREIMRAHEGEVGLVPIDQGATFRLRFPRPQESRDAKVDRAVPGG